MELWLEPGLALIPSPARKGGRTLFSLEVLNGPRARPVSRKVGSLWMKG